MRARARFTAVLLIFVSATASAQDVLYLHNGDRITGELLSADAKAYNVKTPYAGEIAVQRDAVRVVETAEPVAVRMPDGQVREGRLAETDGGQGLQWSGGQTTLTAFETIAPDAAAFEEAEAEARKWHGAYNAGVAIQSGQTDKITANTSLTLEREWRKHTLRVLLSGGYGEVDSQVDSRQAKGEAEYRYYPRKRLYFLGVQGFEHDAGRKLELRSTTSAGVGYDFIKNEERSLSGDVGLAYIRERWLSYSLVEYENAKQNAKEAKLARARTFLTGMVSNPGATVSDWARAAARLARDIDALDVEQEVDTEDALNLRLSGRYKQKLWSKSTLEEELTIHQELSGLDRVRAVNTLSLTTPVGGAISLRTALKSEYDSKPGTRNVENWEHYLTTSLHYDF